MAWLDSSSLIAWHARVVALKPQLIAWGLQLRTLRQRHARATAWSIAVLLGGGTALSLAVAPLAPDAALLPQRVITETVQTEPIEPQLEALAALDLSLSRTEVSRAGENLAALFKRLGVTDANALRFAQSDATLRRTLEGRAGRLVTVRATQSGLLQELVVRLPADKVELAHTHFQRVSLTPSATAAGRFEVSSQTEVLATESRFAGGTIRTSLFAATDEARIPDAVASQMAEIFSGDIDFHRELRKGDSFNLVYEAVTADGMAVPWNQGSGRVLAAEFVSGGRTHQAIWFETAAGKGNYFDPTGKSRKRVFLASPMEFSRVTSGFAMRMHPIHQVWRRHLGVDYAAPTGTPVRSVGDATVEFAGWQSGFGNVVHLSHGNGRVTVYGHLSRIDVRKGQRVQQGQRVGAVGATGWATGPHLHFEFRINGAHQDPLKVARASETITLDATARPRFADMAQIAQGKLEVAGSLAGGRSNFE